MPLTCNVGRQQFGLIFLSQSTQINHIQTQQDENQLQSQQTIGLKMYPAINSDNGLHHAGRLDDHLASGLFCGQGTEYSHSPCSTQSSKSSSDWYPSLSRPPVRSSPGRSYRIIPPCLRFTRTGIFSAPTLTIQSSRITPQAIFPCIRIRSRPNIFS